MYLNVRTLSRGICLSSCAGPSAPAAKLGHDRRLAAGRLVGGCVETMVADTPDGDVGASEHAADRHIVYLEAAEDDAATIARNPHGLWPAGSFENARAVRSERHLVCRPSCPS